MTSMASAPAYTMPAAVTVVHPPHLEGDALLATEILPGPPSLLSLQQTAAKRDPKKPAPAFSYLPATDPGSTYSGNMAGTSTLGAPDVDGPRRKRARIDKGGATGRAQRASGRVAGAVTPVSDPSAPEAITAASSVLSLADSEVPVAMPVDSDPPSISRSNSAPNLDEPRISSGPAPRGRPKGSTKDKGKGKQVDKSVIRVKEEEVVPMSLSPSPPAGPLNEDHCSACAYMGSLVYCDGCPKAYHLWCLDPPMEPSDIPEGDKWFCPGCILRKNPPPKPPPSLMSPLLVQAHTNSSMPREYQVPDDIRNFFKDVGAGPRGAYADTSEAKKPRLNHYGQIEDREPYRLKDRNNAPIICFRCGTSALPENAQRSDQPPAKRPRRSTSKATSTLETGKLIVSCDYCHLHWHLDCLDPPLATMPSINKKWMCPNHADQTLQPKRRIPKLNAPPIEITKPKQFNNGNIEIIHPQAPLTTQEKKVAVDEVLINGRRYRVPERVIMLDFWNKISSDRNSVSNGQASESVSAMSSPLTSLSSLDDLEEIEPAPLNTSTQFARPVSDSDILAVAQLLCGLRTHQDVPLNGTNGISNEVSETAQSRSRPPSDGIAERPKRSLPVRLTTNPAANGRHAASKPLSAGPSSSTSKRPRRGIKPEPEEAADMPSTKTPAHKTTSRTDSAGRSQRSLRSRNPNGSISPDKPTAINASSTVVRQSPPRSAPVNAPSTPLSPLPTTTVTAPTTPSLKIRLPRLSGLNLQAHTSPVQTPTRSSSFSSTPASSDSRLRRSSRQRLSTSASMETSSSSSSSVGALKINGTSVPPAQPP